MSVDRPSSATRATGDQRDPFRVACTGSYSCVLPGANEVEVTSRVERFLVEVSRHDVAEATVAVGGGRDPGPLPR